MHVGVGISSKIVHPTWDSAIAEMSLARLGRVVVERRRAAVMALAPRDIGRWLASASNYRQEDTGKAVILRRIRAHGRGRTSRASVTSSSTLAGNVRDVAGKQWLARPVAGDLASLSGNTRCDRCVRFTLRRLGRKGSLAAHPDTGAQLPLGRSGLCGREGASGRGARQVRGVDCGALGVGGVSRSGRWSARGRRRRPDRGPPQGGARRARGSDGDCRDHRQRDEIPPNSLLRAAIHSRGRSRSGFHAQRPLGRRVVQVTVRSARGTASTSIHTSIRSVISVDLSDHG